MEYVRDLGVMFYLTVGVVVFLLSDVLGKPWRGVPWQLVMVLAVVAPFVAYARMRRRLEVAENQAARDIALPFLDEFRRDFSQALHALVPIIADLYSVFRRGRDLEDRWDEFVNRVDFPGPRGERDLDLYDFARQVYVAGVEQKGDNTTDALWERSALAREALSRDQFETLHWRRQELTTFIHKWAMATKGLDDARNDIARHLRTPGTRRVATVVYYLEVALAWVNDNDDPFDDPIEGTQFASSLYRLTPRP